MEKASALEVEINERREAIQRLIGVTPITTAPKPKPRSAVTDEEARDAMYELRGRGDTFTTYDVSDLLECSYSTGKRVITDQEGKGTVELVKKGGPRRPSIYRFKEVRHG